MHITESQILEPTDTFFDDDGEIVCVTRVTNSKSKPNSRHHTQYYTYYGEYCTGDKSNDGLEYAFYYRNINTSMEQVEAKKRIH